MSTYEDYSRTSADYDRTREAVGADLLLGALVGAGVDLASAHVLDAGCGTGSYAAALAPHVGRLTLVDANPEMLAVAEAKLAALGPGAEVTTRQGTLPDLGLPEAAFDAVMTNQVLHHLGDREGGDWSAHRAAVAHLGGLVRTGGCLAVTTCSPAQMRRAYWYYALVPAAADALRQRYAPLEVLEEAAVDAGLAPVGRHVPVAALVQGASALDGLAPLDPLWRNGDSVWALAAPAEVEGALATVRDLEQRGELDAFVTAHDAERLDLGQVTVVVAQRR